MLRRSSLGASRWIAAVGFVAAIAVAAPMPVIPPAPDYSQAAAWAVWPGRPSEADVVPSGIVDTSSGEASRVDVFFVHPTTYLSRPNNNAHFDEPGVTTTLIERGVLRSQVSAFNHCCRIYAPHYRQAALAAFFHRNDAADAAALDLAYQDVLRAFDFYLASENHGRPFIIAGHSQGSLHVLRLLQERIAGKAVQKQMVAAYVIGYFVPQEIERTGLGVCRAATQTGCLISWNTVKPNAATTEKRSTHLVWLSREYQRLGDRPVVCTNPLNWSLDRGEAPASLNLGALPGVHPSQDLRPIIPALTGASCHDGELAVSIPWGRRHGFADALTLFGSYHIYDYNLFYTNIRVNADERAAAFLSRNHVE